MRRNRLTRRSRRRTAHGFTLLELLIAMALFAVISVMSFGGLKSVLRTRDATQLAAQRLGGLQVAFSLMQRDLAAVIDRPVRDQLGDPLAAVIGGEGGEAFIEFTRTGWPNPRGEAISELRRIAYRVRDNVLYRANWRVLDRAYDSAPLEYPVLEGVTGLQLRYLDAKQEWLTDWPPLTPDPTDSPVPLALEVTFEIEGWGTVRRLFRMGG